MISVYRPIGNRKSRHHTIKFELIALRDNFIQPIYIYAQVLSMVDDLCDAWRGRTAVTPEPLLKVGVTFPTLIPKTITLGLLEISGEVPANIVYNYHINENVYIISSGDVNYYQDPR